MGSGLVILVRYFESTRTVRKRTTKDKNHSCCVAPSLGRVSARESLLQC